MTRSIGDDRRLKQVSWIKPLFYLFGLALIALTIACTFFPKPAQQVLAEPTVAWVSEHFILLMIIGTSLFSVARLFSARKPTKNQTITPEQTFHTAADNKDFFDINSSATAPSINWQPLKGGGANFKTHNLRPGQQGQMEFVVAWQMKLFAIFFAGIGAIVGGVFLFAAGEIIPFFIGLVFVVIGVSIYYFSSTPRVFDKRLNYYWKGRIKSESAAQVMALKEHCALSDIYGLQILSEYIKGDKSNYYSYELNIIRQDGSRLCVVDHGNLEQIRQDANTLSQYLKVPVFEQ
ncbi:MAG: hypothetical protein HWE13_08440 [Gammaproteobacteria bacterium]|nr:hypothetical protein [Gammaproteobacteria bacterium]NVK88141.1 hypothetical protein [Gammaproteobacteria bacterium]